MEGLQIAQILADLSDLQNTEPAAAKALLSAYRSPPPKLRSQSSASSQVPKLSQSQSQSQQDLPKFDRLGRRIVRPAPSLARTSSSLDQIKGLDSTRPRSPGDQIGANETTDEDLHRARTLLELFEQRGRFKQMGDTGLLRSKERVDVVAARYAARDLDEKEKMSRLRHLTSKA